MGHDNDAWAEAQRRRFMRPDAHLWIRPDAYRFMAPGAPRLLGKDAVRYFWPEAPSEQKYSPDQPRVPAGHSDGGQWTDGSANPSSDASVESILELADRIFVAGGSLSYQACLDICYPLLERFKPPGSDRNQWDFIKCMNACLKRK